MKKEKEEMLEKLREIKQKAQIDLKNNHVGYENCIVKNVIHYNKPVELINKNTKEKEKFDLCEVIIMDPETQGESSMYYLNGEEVDFSELLKNYESPEPIKDVVDKTKENEEKEEEEQDEELKKDSLEELENEKEQEEKEEKDKSENKNEEKEDTKSRKEPKNVIQSIDPHKTYVNSVETVSNAFEISSEVDELVISDTEAGDKNALSNHKTIHMLDKDGKIIEEANGKDINDLFEYDDATGNNPMYDDNTKLELDGYAEKNQGQTMARFKSKENPDLHFSVEQKKWGQYNQVYAEQKTRDGNDAVGVELETDNSNIQTDLEEQKIMGYSSGDYQKEYVDKEADLHEEHGDNEEKIDIKNVDGDKITKAICDNPFVPDTQITWEQFSKSLGDKEIEEVFKEFFEKYNGRNGKELVLSMQEEYKEQIEQEEIEQETQIETKEELEEENEFYRAGPWDSAKH